jgi:uncharacterized NAD-dependent epimerase/dehydratase family protein
MFLGDAADQLAAKTAAGVAMWRPDWCVGQLRLDGCGADLGLPDMTLEEAAAGGARTLIVGVANRGGVISDDWMAALHRALGDSSTCAIRRGNSTWRTASNGAAGGC